MSMKTLFGLSFCCLLLAGCIYRENLTFEKHTALFYNARGCLLKDYHKIFDDTTARSITMSPNILNSYPYCKEVNTIFDSMDVEWINYDLDSTIYFMFRTRGTLKEIQTTIIFINDSSRLKDKIPG